MKAIHEYDSRGNHRLGVSKKVAGDLTKDAPVKWSKWASYTAPALIKRGKTCLVAVTDYYIGSSEFPSKDKLYIVSEAHGYNLEVKV